MLKPYGGLTLKKSVASIVELPCCVMALILPFASNDALFLGSPHLPMLMVGLDMAILLLGHVVYLGLACADMAG
jgi:hypothetical protein